MTISPYRMLADHGKSKSRTIGIIVLIFFAIVIIGATLGRPSEKPSKEQGPLTLEQRIQNDVKSNLHWWTGELKSAEVVNGTDGAGRIALVKIILGPDIVWDEKSLVQQASSATVNIMGALFAKYDQILMIQIIAEANFTDVYGKESTQNAVNIVMSKETASKIEWKNLIPMVEADWRRLRAIADKFAIHPAITLRL